MWDIDHGVFERFHKTYRKVDREVCGYTANDTPEWEVLLVALLDKFRTGRLALVLQLGLLRFTLTGLKKVSMLDMRL